MIVKYRTPLIDLLIFIDIYGNMAQLVEQLTVNQWVTGSSPVTPAINLLPVLVENRLVSVNAL